MKSVMKWITSSFQQLKSWFRNRLTPLYRTVFIAEELPELLDKKSIYIVYEDDFFWHVSMVCPCGCEAILHMNLVPDEYPYWHLTQHDDNTVSLSPSVWRQKGCFSHFWFRQGRVHWCSSEAINPLL